MSSGQEIAVGLDGEIREYVRLRREAEKAEAASKDARQRADDQRDRLWDLLDAAGVKTINHELGRVTRTARLQAIVQDRESLDRWLLDNGLYEAMTKRDYRKANLNGLAAELLDDGKQLPDGLDTLSIRGIRFTRS